MDLLKVNGRIAALDINFSIHMHYISVWNGVRVQDAKQQPGEIVLFFVLGRIASLLYLGLYFIDIRSKS